MALRNRSWIIGLVLCSVASIVPAAAFAQTATPVQARRFLETLKFADGPMMSICTQAVLLDGLVRIQVDGSTPSTGYGAEVDAARDLTLMKLTVPTVTEKGVRALRAAKTELDIREVPAPYERMLGAVSDLMARAIDALNETSNVVTQSSGTNGAFAALQKVNQTRQDLFAIAEQYESLDSRVRRTARAPAREITCKQVIATVDSARRARP